MPKESEELQSASVEVTPGPLNDKKVSAESAKKCVESLHFI